jgi:ketosteroid isomerase-like protein
MSQAEISSLEDQRFQAQVGGDLDALERLLSDQLVYTHSSASVDTKASFIESIKTRRPYQKVERSGEEVRLHGDTAVVTGQARIDLNGGRQLNLRYTDVWVKSADGWRMVAWQSTRLPE